MLYERWREIARTRGAEIALRDLRRGRHWTFAELEAASKGAAEAPVSFPQDSSAEFVFTVLRAWRSGRVVCPLAAGQPPPPAFAHIPPGIVHLKTTSATTGPQRVVAFTGAQLAADADNIVRTMGLRPDWPNLGVISLAHSYGFSNLVTPLLLHGIPLVLLDSPLPEVVRRAAADLREVTLPAVPALWRAWHEARAIPKNVRLAISAGAPLPLALEQELFQQLGIKLHNFYGSTECGGIACDASETPRADAAQIGAPMRGVSLSINEEGCLEVRGRAVGETYWPEPSPTLAGGCFRTSDLAALRNGQVFLHGRASDQINVAGRKLSPESVERLLLAHPSVRDCLVLGVPGQDASRAELIVACVVARHPVAEGTLKQFLLAQLPSWQVPRHWWFVDSLAHNQRGKLSRSEWRERYLEQRAGQRQHPANTGK